MTMDATLKEKIEKDIQGNKILLYMKGTPDAPQCGFSNQVVKILKRYNAEFTSRDILQDESLRQGMKEFSNWPTFPQLYVKGQFIGGCDIVNEMAKSGELEKIIQ